MQLAQLDRRLDPKLLDQHPASITVSLQGLRLAPASIQRQHQLASQPLPVRMLAHEPLDFADQQPRTPELKLGSNPLLQSDNPQLRQASDLGLSKLLVLEIAQRPASSQRQRLTQLLHSRLEATR